MKRATRRPAARSLAAAALIGFLALAPATGASTLALKDAGRTRLVATVHAVDSKTRVIELITGVGYATRVVRFEVADDCDIVVPWAAAHLSSFVPGTHVRIEYVAAPATAKTAVPNVVVRLEAYDAERGGAP